MAKLSPFKYLVASIQEENDNPTLAILRDELQNMLESVEEDIEEHGEEWWPE